ncbi:MAG: EAL domain-containing protein [Succinivibrio sp.]|nr:EAL domain-containing protein [Succinivibrio sp.]
MNGYNNGTQSIAGMNLDNTCKKIINTAIENSLVCNSPSKAVALLLKQLGESLFCDKVSLFDNCLEGQCQIGETWSSPDIPSGDEKSRRNIDPQILPELYVQTRNDNILAVADISSLRTVSPKVYESLKESGVRSFISCRLTFLHEDLGYLVFKNPSETYYSVLTKNLTPLIYFISSLINSRKHVEKLEKIGFQDRLTGCGNRHGLYEFINGLDRNESIGVMYGDVNDLKVVNDNEGHDAGDALLVTVAQALIKVFGVDRSFRMGGDEFVAVGTGIAKKAWNDSIQELRNALAEKNIFIAIGSYWIDKFKLGFDEIIRTVDSMMYEDKRAYYASHNADVDHTGYIPSYDIMIKIKPDSGSYKVVEDTLGLVDRLTMPENFKEFINNRTRQVHPDDRSSYAAFWNLNDIGRRIKRNKGERSIYFDYRVKKNGKWQWVEDVVVLFERDDEQVLVCLMRSIQFRKRQELLTQYKQSGKLRFNLPRTDDFIKQATVWTTRMGLRKIGIAAIDINFFKLFNEIYGHVAGSRLLERVATILSVEAKKLNGLSGYMGGDNFCVLFPMDSYTQEDVTSEIDRLLRRHKFVSGFVPVVGVYIWSDRGSVTAAYDKALIALSSIKGSLTERVNFYDAGKYRRMPDTQAVVTAAQRGFKNGEFTFFLQPRVSLSHHKVVSSDALIRWEHQDVIMSPTLFMRAMERNGFIYAIDRFIWEQVFIWQCSLIERGINPLPCSVTVSYVDFFFCDVSAFFIGLCKRYRLDPRYIQIKITEKCYTQNTEQFKKVIDSLRACGFRIILHNYENIYTAMELLRNVDIDILMISHNLLHKGLKQDLFRPDYIVHFAHMLNIKVIAEGIEYPDQVKKIEELKCDYASGFFFFKPMTQSLYEILLTEPDKIEKDEVEAEDVQDDLCFSQLMNGGLLSEQVVDSVFGAMAVVEVKDDRIEIVRENEKFLILTGIKNKSVLTVQDGDSDGERLFLEIIELSLQPKMHRQRVHDYRCTYQHAQTGESVVLKNRVFPVNVRNGRKFYLLLVDEEKSV